ncbi:MAG: hypothetical protein BGO45_10190 [Microbacterium sp. 71-36]|uniref:hypothetical protein n=1 Tax=unclassified Microbacterium TaxID=2609290 RepID=UPI00086967BA|nr:MULTISPECIES: hypothetical protein [unclassified Microbacterium]MBN9210952.1 hypothetical protein [Microbacterium sp.]ODT38817.1 MAG: hypothetical protein ABS60_08995 [Microbacterium sp. SCN 71-17]OJV77165.1 MAG: hypothetical protein BGO45_10190 [Microbacterium sp. 71-36]
MNTSLTRAPQHTASALSLPTVETSAERRLGLLDRLSLRLGLWLLTRAAARADQLAPRTVRANVSHRAALERAQREIHWQRQALLSRPPL